jgi:hypothetical protein
MTAVTETHEEKLTLQVDVNLPGHDPRVATALFTRTRATLLERTGAKCFICRRTAEQSGHPLEAHHYPIERSFAEAIDFGPGSRIREDFPAFDWAAFDKNPDPYLFVDDMTVNGLPLCKDHHTAADMGIHMLPHPVWIAQAYVRDGYQFSSIEIIHTPGQEPEKGKP